nr:hypothetical protein [uncultured Anaerosporobacter sp.]
MSILLPICCAEECPLHKKNKCCFGEVYSDCLHGSELRERHKCKNRKSTGLKYVDAIVAEVVA